MKDLGKRPWLLATVVAFVVAALGITAANILLGPRADRTATPAPGPTWTSDASPTPTGSAAAAPTPAQRTWWSGAAGEDAATGAFGKWRGEPVAIGGAWVNGNEEQVEMYEICNPRSEWRDWNAPLDLAIGAINVDRGETWAEAARGAYDTRWRKHLQNTKKCWGNRDPGLLYIRFAHEMNLERIDWRVRGGEEKDFVRALKRYSDLRYEIMPGLKIVLCPNDGTEEGLDGLDIRKLWPGKDGEGRPIADVYAVDSYNQWPHVTSKDEFIEKITERYDNGMPLGMEAHRQFAEEVGVPFAIGEWSNNGDRDFRGGGGESPLYVREFHAWASKHAGDPADPRPGQLLYEIHFNLWDEFAFWPDNIQPRTAAAYRALTWGVPSSA